MHQIVFRYLFVESNIKEVSLVVLLGLEIGNKP